MESLIYYLPQCPIPYKIICHLSLSELNLLKSGVNLINGKSELKNEFGPILIPLIIYKYSDSNLTICRNKCRHAGGNFVHDIEDIVKCSYHGWKLNCRTLEYIRPKNGLKQKELVIDKQADGSWIVLEEILFSPWSIDEKIKENLEENEMMIEFLNSSTILIGKFLIDPYLIGPSFGRTYWLLDEIQTKTFDQLKEIKSIFITKCFSNHFNLPTLQEIVKRNAQIQIYIPSYPFDHFTKQLDKLGFENIVKIPFGIWKEIDQFSRFLILPDHQHPNIDCSILYEYKGHQILYLSDCQYPNGNYLPYSVDVLITKYASHRSSYPYCYFEQFDEIQMKDIQKEKDEKFHEKLIKFIQSMNPVVWIPFGENSYPLHPDDKQFAKVYSKIDPHLVQEIIEKRLPKLKVWLPFSNGKYDLGSQTGDQLVIHSKKSIDFQTYIDQFDQYLAFEPCFQLYFQWTKFANYDLILHIIETNNDFSVTLREYYIDFLHLHPIYPSSCPSNRPYLRLKIRASILRHTFLHGSSWIDIYYGLNGFYFAQPNIYHEKFWKHFKYNLPLEPPELN